MLTGAPASRPEAALGGLESRSESLPAELDALNLAPTCLRLAELYEAAGRRPDAVAMYRRVDELWRTGDRPFRRVAAQAEARARSE